MGKSRRPGVSRRVKLSTPGIPGTTRLGSSNSRVLNLAALAIQREAALKRASQHLSGESLFYSL